MVWNTNNLLYWTDPGDLSASVNHAAADAMVATAASAWNVSVSAMVVSQGGVLAEDVSGSNVYLGSNGPVFPADVQMANATAIPVAVIYDTDGTVTDTLLGGGASDPGNCRQAAVTESVDGISAVGKITHALLVLNGRCTGAAAEMQMEMTYRLVRAFGRILGVGWSQLNDNMFTGVPAVTYAQAMHWPVMHPIDAMCGPYAYQCMPLPLVLRPDDVATLVALYPEGGADAGKTSSFAKATPFNGVVSFPNGQGMAGVNVVARRWNQSTTQTDAFEEVSGVTGALFQQMGASPVTAKGTNLAASQGWANSSLEGKYLLPWVPIDTTTYWQSVILTTQAINPLYTGQYAVGPYGFGSQVLPSGSPVTFTRAGIGPGYSAATVNLTVPDAAATCTVVADGTAAVPVSVDPSGMWQGMMCGYGHTSWFALPVKAGRTLTVEMTAVDEQGLATTAKIQPVFGVWASTDATTVLPTVVSASTPLNTTTLGMTAATMSNDTARTLRMGFGDQRGDGRPDFGYKARVLYADQVTPSALPANGGSITITGMGFRNGNAVLVNGVAAQVLSWAANTIVAVAPAIVGRVTADVTVLDGATGGQTTVTGALTYSGTTLPDGLAVVSLPADGSVLGVAAPTVLGVKVSLPDGVSPAVGVGVLVTATNGAVLMGCASVLACSLTTDGTGMVRTAVLPTVSGPVTLGAAVGTVTATASFTAGSRAADVLRVTSLPVGTVFAGVPAILPLIVQVTLGDGVTPDAGAQVTVTAQGAGLGGCGGASTCVLTADGLGLVATTVTPLAAGVVALTASAGSGTVVASFGAAAMPADGLRVISMPASGLWVGSTASFQVQVMLGDGVTPGAGAAVTVLAVGAGLGACGGTATCVLTADATGMVATAVTPGLVGVVSLSAVAGGGQVQVTFTSMAIPPDRLLLLSVPANGNVAGVVSALPFSVRLFAPDGLTPVVGAMVTLTSTGGVFGACGLPVCLVPTDATGTAGSTVTPAAAGTVRVSAAVAGLSVANSFTAVADTVRLVSLPAGQAYVGVPTPSPVVLQALGTDGVTPAVGLNVTVRLVSPGTLGACGAATCVLTADAQGMVSTLVTPTAQGVATIQAAAGGGALGTSFGVAAMPPDVLRVLSVPSGLVYTGVLAAAPVTFQVLRGDGINPDPGALIQVSAQNASLQTAGCGTSCSRVTDANGMITSTVLPQHDGTITVRAVSGYAQATATFVSVPLPPDVLTVMSSPADGSVPGKVASALFSVQAMLGDGITVAAGVQVTMTAVGATLGCGQTTCVLWGNTQGQVSTPVKPSAAGIVMLTASAGGGLVTSSFVAVMPPDALQVVSVPADGALAGQVAARMFQVKVTLGDGVTAGVGESVTLTAAGGTLGTCGLMRCIVTAGAGGLVATTVTPTVSGTVALTASAGGGSVSASFAAVAPADTLTVLSGPANGSFVGRAAAVAFAVKVMLWDGSAASGSAVTLTASAGTLGACGAGSCVVTANASGMVSTTVTPTASGVIGLTAAAGGGTVRASFSAVAVPPDALTVVSLPANGSYVGRIAAAVFGVKVLLGDGTVGAREAVTLTVSGGTLGACGLGSCTLTADGAGMVSTPMTPTTVGTVGLTAAAGGGTASASFVASALPPDGLTVVSVPANGAFVGRTAAVPFQVKVSLWDGSVAVGAAVTLTASGGTLAACGSGSCGFTADSAGMVSTTVTPGMAGLIGLTAASGGGVIAASFTAMALPPDVLTVVSVPGSGGYVGSVAAGVFGVKVMLGDGTVGAGAPVTLTAIGGTLGVCGAASCVVTADGAGMVSSAVTPGMTGTIGLMAAAGGGTAGVSFVAVAMPADLLSLMSVPASGGFVGDMAGVWRVKVTMGDGVTAASGVPVTMTAIRGTLGICGATTCVVTADASGIVATTVTATSAGTIALRASAGGGVITASFGAVDHVLAVSLVQSMEYVAAGAQVSWTPRVLATMDGVPVAVAVTWTGGEGMVVGDSAASSNTVVVGPLGAGGTAAGQACAWGTVCASFGAVVVDEAEWQIAMVSGGGQVVGVGGVLDPVVARVVDGGGHGVAGVPVSVHEGVNGYVVCPAAGRCPVGPGLGDAVSMVVSDSDGMVSVAPWVVVGVGETTGMVLTAGENGFLSTSLSMIP